MLIHKILHSNGNGRFRSGVCSSDQHISDCESTNWEEKEDETKGYNLSKHHYYCFLIV